MRSLKLLEHRDEAIKRGAIIGLDFTPSKRVDSSYQSEASLESEFIATLQAQGYEYAKITNEAALESNLRAKLEELNSTTLSDTEWQRFFRSVLAKANTSIEEKSALIQEHPTQPLERDDGSSINFKLIDKDNIHKNSLQVINQFQDAKRSSRYDVTILVNGLPLVHIELKRRGVSLKEAFRQIDRYGRESFFSGNALFEFVQIFVISNGTQSKYYSNTTRDLHIKTTNGIKTTKTSNSFEFTSYFSNEKNSILSDLTDFTKSFFAKRTLLNILCHYCVFDAGRKLLVMRPYQIAACEAILQQIAISYFNKFYEKSSTQKSGGYIWHTTGSGKTLTSFKTAQLVSRYKEIAKVLFVVDRKDLDYQTMREYERFEKGAATGSKSIKDLQAKLHSKEHKIIITTIQKLSKFVERVKNSEMKNSEIFDEHIVMIFDECHRSQFGKMQKSIAKAFKKLYLFGFTGTPIFDENAPKDLQTTRQVFGKCLHKYTIINAIRDHNVLPFGVSYYHSKAETTQNDPKASLETDLLNPNRIKRITTHILENFATQTKRGQTYTANNKSSINGFNAILATQSIPMAIAYYKEFKAQQEAKSNPLKVGIIYSYALEEEENSEDTSDLPESQRTELDAAISDYNAMFKCSFSSGANFQNYYKDFSQRLQNRDLDLAIVVNMFLTGFDAPTLNTLYVDKPLRYHGLLQAYSRTNRILNSIKSFGNIIAYRDLQTPTDEALALFSDEKNAQNIVFLRSLKEYLEGYTDEQGKKHQGYNELITTLQNSYPLSPPSPFPLEENEAKEFIDLFNKILKLRNIVEHFEDFSDPLSPRDRQDYQSHYIDIIETTKTSKPQPGGNPPPTEFDDIEFEIEHLKNVDIDIAYILNLISKKRGIEWHSEIEKLINSSVTLRPKKQLIMDFINYFISQKRQSIDIAKDFSDYINKRKEEHLEQIITALELKPKETREFMRDTFERGELREYGQAFAEILPKAPLFGKGSSHSHKIRAQALQKLQEFFELFRI